MTDAMTVDEAMEGTGFGAAVPSTDMGPSAFVASSHEEAKKDEPRLDQHGMTTYVNWTEEMAYGRVEEMR